MDDQHEGDSPFARQLIANARLMLAYERGEYEPPKVKTVEGAWGEAPRPPDPPAPLTDEDLAEIAARLARVADVSSFDYAANPKAAAHWDIEEIVEVDAPALLAEVKRLRAALAAAPSDPRTAEPVPSAGR